MKTMRARAIALVPAIAAVWAFTAACAVLPDSLKTERMIAEEAYECMIAKDQNVGVGLMFLGMTKDDYLDLITGYSTKEQLIAERDKECAEEG